MTKTDKAPADIDKRRLRNRVSADKSRKRHRALFEEMTTQLQRAETLAAGLVSENNRLMAANTRLSVQVTQLTAENDTLGDEAARLSAENERLAAENAAYRSFVESAGDLPLC